MSIPENNFLRLSEDEVKWHINPLAPQIPHKATTLCGVDTETPIYSSFLHGLSKNVSSSADQCLYCLYPELRETAGASLVKPNVLIEKPHGLKNILIAAGAKKFTKEGFVTDPEHWATNYLEMAKLPAPIPNGVSGKDTVDTIQIHKNLGPSLEALMSQIYRNHQEDYKKLTYCGSFNPRMKRGLTEPSLHGLGYAIDFNADVFPLNRSHIYKLSDQPLWFQHIINVFHAYGWKWGGDFGDGMHFQGADGY